MDSLHRNKGGAKSKLAEPSEKEGMGLAVGAAMLWCKLRDSSSGAFFPKISAEVKRCMEGDRDFSKEAMVHFVQNKIFGGIPQHAVERWIQYACLGKEGDELVAWQKDTIQNFMYRYVGSVDSGSDYAEALKLCKKACVEEILQCKALGGRPEWRLEDFLEKETWHQLGGKAGIKECAKKLLTVVAAAGRKEGRIDPYCSECGEVPPPLPPTCPQARPRACTPARPPASAPARTLTPRSPAHSSSSCTRASAPIWCASRAAARRCARRTWRTRC